MQGSLEMEGFMCECLPRVTEYARLFVNKLRH